MPVVEAQITSHFSVSLCCLCVCCFLRVVVSLLAPAVLVVGVLAVLILVVAAVQAVVRCVRKRRLTAQQARSSRSSGGASRPGVALQAMGGHSTASTLHLTEPLSSQGRGSNEQPSSALFVVDLDGSCGCVRACVGV